MIYCSSFDITDDIFFTFIWYNAAQLAEYTDLFISNMIYNYINIFYKISIYLS